MRIMIDISHPAHIHYFRNFAKIMEKRGHQYLMTLRGKDIIIKLAEYYHLHYKIRSAYTKEFETKLNYALSSIKSIYKISRAFKPNFFVDMGTVFAAPVAKFQGIPYIAFEDTEDAYKARLLFMPFTSFILTPKCFYKDLGKKQIKFNGYMELFYLHDKYFIPDINVLNELGLTSDKKTCIVRFISWKAFHDKGQKGFLENEKIEFVKEISKRARVFISSESEEINDDLKPYLINMHPGKLHHLLAYSDLYIGEGVTMTSECAVLGVPAILYNSRNTGYINEQEKYGMVFGYNSYKDVLEKTIQILKNDNARDEWKIKRQKMLSNKINVTDFLVWFVENYPESSRIMNENPNYQYNFK